MLHAAASWSTTHRSVTSAGRSAAILSASGRAEPSFSTAVSQESILVSASVAQVGEPISGVGPNHITRLSVWPWSACSRSSVQKAWE